MLQTLDDILMSDNVVEKFFVYYSKPEFKKWLLDILPEIEHCKIQKQDNPWHIYDCLNHILHSVENINMQTKHLPFNIRRLLAYVMFYHDIGKPACHIHRYSKLYGRKVDSFFGHNVKSEEIAKRTLKYFDFDKEEISVMLKLINKHDIFMFITMYDDGNTYHKVLSNQLILEEIDDLNSVGNGKELLLFLIMIGRADNLSQNPKMTKLSLELLDKMYNMVTNLK